MGIEEQTWKEQAELMQFGKFEGPTNPADGTPADGRRVDDKINKLPEKKDEPAKIDPIARNEVITNLQKVELAHRDPPPTDKEINAFYLGMGGESSGQMVASIEGSSS